MAYISKRNRKKEKERQIAANNRGELIAAGFKRRDLLKMGLLTSAGMLIPKKGLSAHPGIRAVSPAKVLRNVATARDGVDGSRGRTSPANDLGLQWHHAGSNDCRAIRKSRQPSKWLNTGEATKQSALQQWRLWAAVSHYTLAQWPHAARERRFPLLLYGSRAVLRPPLSECLRRRKFDAFRHGRYQGSDAFAVVSRSPHRSHSGKHL